jgi:UDP:flavonoid glycosyltransferase YjiC (YdhE family)
VHIARFLFTTIPFQGRLHTQIAVAHRLQEMGHTVAFAVTPRLQPIVVRAGLKVLNGLSWGQELLDTRQARALLDRSWNDKGLRRLFANLGQEATILAALLRHWQADALVSAQTPIGAIAAEAVGIPYADVCGMALPINSTALPPYGLGLSPYARRGLGWLLNQLRWSTLTHSGDRLVNRVRRAYGLPPAQRSLFEPSPYLLLAFTTELIEYRRPDLPPQVWFVGPVADSTFDNPEDFPWDCIAADRPLVYADLDEDKHLDEAQAHQSQGLLNGLIEASRDQFWQIVIDAELSAKAAKKLRELPSNVLLLRHTPRQILLERSQAVIGTGSYGVVAGALEAGVPLVLLPSGREQAEVAQRVVEVGVGIRRSPYGLRRSELRRTISRVLEEPGLSLSARRIAADFTRCDGPGSAAELLLQLVELQHPIHRALGQMPTLYLN